jgi:Ni/Co efflux regulator RcnB
MKRPRRLLLPLLAAASLAGLPACNEDQAKQDAKQAGHKAEKAGKRAASEAKKAKKDVDGQ